RLCLDGESVSCGRGTEPFQGRLRERRECAATEAHEMILEQCRIVLVLDCRPMNGRILTGIDDDRLQLHFHWWLQVDVDTRKAAIFEWGLSPFGAFLYPVADHTEHQVQFEA